MNYQAAWNRARQARTNLPPKPSDIDDQGSLPPGHAYGAIFYLPESEVASRIAAAQEEIVSFFPADTILRNSPTLYHIAGLIFRDRQSEPLSGSELLAGSEWADFIAQACSQQSPPQFSIYGVNLGVNGTLYAKGYPHTDDFQALRDLAQKRYPQMRYKDAFNLTLGRLYKQLAPEDYARAISVIRNDFLHSYLGTVTFDAINIMNLAGGALNASGKLVREIQFLTP